MPSATFRLMTLSFAATLAVACASTSETDEPDREAPDEEAVDETAQAICGVSCSYRLTSPAGYWYYCSGCGSSAYRRFPWRGHSFCYSWEAC